MSAPDSAFSTTYTFKDSTNVFEKLAICRSAYVNDANVKSKFHLDFQRVIKDKNGNECFFGGVIEGGSNSLFHNSSTRYSKLYAELDGIKYRLLNDSGLNCRPYCYLGGSMIARFADYIRFSFTCTSAFYSKTTQVAITLFDVTKNVNILENYPIWGYAIADNTSETHSVMIQGIAGISEEDTCRITIQATNEEGTWTNPDYIEYQALGNVEFIHAKLLTAQDQNPDDGTDWCIAVSQSDYGASGDLGLTDLFADEAMSWDETKNGIYTPRMYGVEGLYVTDDMFSNPLPAGHYYGFPSTYAGADKKVLIITDQTVTHAATGQPVGWCASTYVEPLPDTYEGTLTINLTVETTYLYPSVKNYIYAYASTTGTTREVRVDVDVYYQGAKIGRISGTAAGANIKAGSLEVATSYANKTLTTITNAYPYPSTTAGQIEFSGVPATDPGDVK